MSFSDAFSSERSSEELREIADALLLKGKSLRRRLVFQTGRRLKLPAKERRILERIIESIHSASLLHDDLIDRSPVRRNRPSAWLEFSPEQAVLAGDYLLAQTGIFLADTGDLELLKITSQTIMSLVEGEFFQRELIRDRKENERDLQKLSLLKTGCLFQWALRAPFIRKGRRDPKLHTKLNRIGGQLGTLFQRADDLLDFTLRRQDGKAAFSDLKQGYFNSFACFLSEGKSDSFKSRLRKARNFKRFSALIPDYKKKTEAFDRLNKKLIVQAKKEIEGLKPLLKPEEKELIRDLKPLPAAYYRR